MQIFTEHCWNTIGVSGDSSCPELKTVIHCRNCNVYGAAGRTLLQREAPEGYIEEWGEILAQEWKHQSKKKTQSSVALHTYESESSEILCLTIFRVGQEWLALPVSVIKEITPCCPVHILPHRSNHVFLGIVNIRGEILMCISLRDLLGLPHVDPVSSKTKKSLTLGGRSGISPVVYQRMIVIDIQDNRWVFPVDEISDIHRLSSDQLSNTPVVIAKTPDTYTKKILHIDGKQINYLDHELIFYELLFYTLNRS
ncbi:CheW protein [Rippkaea orientalis PCC 8801]|uniref:CheW protein n=1 Tax=Rippkaea orientalis (strain PCC 8801 / RF-1) TaxID=41431 RepID=B7JYY8_RIPO1|nr:chemotaxis protein CheW [Rippkaea orientalis]ACK66065.1 CheW protein [Rippkaea orientalis PCC 8801]